MSAVNWPAMVAALAALAGALTNYLRQKTHEKQSATIHETLSERFPNTTGPLVDSQVTAEKPPVT